MFLRKVSFTILKGDKICFLAEDDMSKTMLFNILMGKEKLKAGKMRLPIPKDDAANGIATVAGQIYFAEDANGNGFARIYYDNADGKRL